MSELSDLKSNTDLAVEIQSAISAIIVGGLSSYSIGGRSFTKNNLAELQKIFIYYRDLSYEDEYGGATVTLASTGDYKWRG